MKRTYQTALCAAFFTSGLCTTLLAALSPWIVARYHLSDRELGAFFGLQFFSSFLSSAIGARMPLGSLRAGFLCFSVGTLLFCVSHPVAAYLSVAFTGLGVGFVNSAGNVMRAYLPNAAEGLIAINFMWSFGTLAATLLMRNLTRNVELTLVSISFIAMAQALFWLYQSGHFHPANHVPGSTLSYEVLFALALFLYVGAENGIAAWTRLLFRSSTPTQAGDALIAFMTAMLIGRLASPHVMKSFRLSVNTTVTLALLGGAICACLVPVVNSPLARAALIAGAGLLISPSFALIVLVFARRMPQQRAWAFCSAGLGASAVPFVMGRMSAHTGLPRAFEVPALALVAALLVTRGAQLRTELAPAT